MWEAQFISLAADYKKLQFTFPLEIIDTILLQNQYKPITCASYSATYFHHLHQPSYIITIVINNIDLYIYIISTSIVYIYIYYIFNLI